MTCSRVFEHLVYGLVQVLLFRRMGSRTTSAITTPISMMPSVVPGTEAGVGIGVGVGPLSGTTRGSAGVVLSAAPEIELRIARSPATVTTSTG